MELSPRLLREVEFGEQWRGYNQAEVDEFLERVAAALESLVQRFQETTARADAAERRLLERGEDDEIRRTLVLAQRTAAVAVEEARAEAERIVAAAEATAAERTAAAEARLQEVEHEIDDRARAEIEALEARRQALAADVDALSAFVDEHRNRLAAELRRELAWLERPELTVPQPPRLQASPPAAAAPSPSPAREPGAREEPVPTPEEAAAEQSLADAGPEPQGTDDEPAVDDLAAAREELERALAGVEEEPSSDAGGAPATGRQIFDVLADDDDEEQSGEPTGLFDALADDDSEDQDDLDVHWRDEQPAAAAAGDDDPFLTELRKAITDDDPLGPRDHDPDVGEDPSSEADSSGWFRLRRPRG